MKLCPCIYRENKTFLFSPTARNFLADTAGFFVARGTETAVRGTKLRVRTSCCASI